MTDLTYNDYYIALIIVTIITIAISIALSFYFIFIPSQRIEQQFDNLQSSGIETLNNLNRLINVDDQISEEILEDTCNSIIYVVNKLFGAPKSTFVPVVGCFTPILPGICITCNPFVPTICDPFLPVDPGCTC